LNEQDKILLSAYLDSDLNDTETAYVEELLQSSDEAKDYLESMKQVKLENKNFFENSLQSQTFKESSSFLKELQSKQTKKFSLSDFLFERKLLFSNLGTLSAAFLIFFVVTDPNQIVENDTLESDSFTDSILEQEFLKFRGADDQPFVKDAILKMHNEKVTNSFIKHGSEGYLLQITDLIINSEYSKCYKFKLSIDNMIEDGVACVKNDTDVEIIYITNG
tara:strand:- start:4293 stop:4952 length:660 start_codon:yes stop_codon:yes gene_type:complete